MLSPAQIAKAKSLRENQHLSHAKIAKALGVTESRIWQLFHPKPKKPKPPPKPKRPPVTRSILEYRITVSARVPQRISINDADRKKYQPNQNELRQILFDAVRRTAELRP